MQVKLLDFIQEKTITRVGGHKKITVNTRIIAATHRDIKAMSEEGSFRQDLYYRLEVFPIQIPPLRKWNEDILPLAQFFLYKLNKKYKRRKYFSKDIAAPLKQYEWPGNIREMEHLIERLYLREEGNELTGETFARLIDKKETVAETIHCSDIVPLKAAKAEIEKQLIQKAYKIYHSSYEVAKALDIDQSTVIKLKKSTICDPFFRRLQMMNIFIKGDDFFHPLFFLGIFSKTIYYRAKVMIFFITFYFIPRGTFFSPKL